MATKKLRQPKPPNDGPNLRSWLPLVVWLVIGAAVLAYFASGFYFVQPDERAVVRRFGKVVQRQASPGLHYAWPAPVGRVDKPKTTAIKRVVVGLDPETRSAIAAGDLVAQTRSTLTDVFTGDVNIVKATMVAQYQITAADEYVTRTSNPDQLVQRAVQAVMVETLGGYSIDEALAFSKGEIQNTTRERAQAMLERYGCGITLVSVDLESIEPPHAIADAFRDVASAKKDREKTIEQAKSFANSTLLKANGRVYEMLAEARSYRENRTKDATGQAGRFLAIHDEYVKAPEVTRTRLLLNTLTRVFEKAKIYVFTPNTDGQPLRITIDRPER